MGISDFINKGKSIISKTQVFEKAVVGKNKREKRQLEQRMLRPDKLPPFDRSKSATNDMRGRTIKLIFPDNQSMALFKKFFHVSESVENSLRDMSLLFALLDELESGRIKYDNKQGISYPRLRNSK